MNNLDPSLIIALVMLTGAFVGLAYSFGELAGLVDWISRGGSDETLRCICGRSLSTHTYVEAQNCVRRADS